MMNPKDIPKPLPVLPPSSSSAQAVADFLSWHSVPTSTPGAPTTTRRKALAEEVEEWLREVKELLRRNKVNHSVLQSRTARLRTEAARLYGSNSEICDHLKPPEGKLSDEAAAKMATDLVARAQIFAARLNEAGHMAFTPPEVGKVFIGHGRSPVWRELKDLLQDRLGLKCDEFNREPVAGLTTSERLSDMLSAAAFAFLVMTAEDERTDQTIHARENVVHEVGLFQGRLGPRKAIVLLEHGCTEFSNIHGLSQIRFPRDCIAAAFEEVRGVLRREGLA